MQANDTNFYGLSNSAGSDGTGFFFRMAPGGHFVVLSSFAFTPQANLSPIAQGDDGNLYSTDFGKGVDGNGTLFEITPAGKLNLLYPFTGGPDSSNGFNPDAIFQATSGTFSEQLAEAPVRELHL